MGLVASWSRLEHAQVMNVHERGFLTFLAEPTRRRMETLSSLARGAVAMSVSCSTTQRAWIRVFRVTSRGARLCPASSKRSCANAAPLRPAMSCPPTAKLDGRELPLGRALEAIIGMGDGAFVSCIPGRLGFYEYEDTQSSYLLERLR